MLLKPKLMYATYREVFRGKHWLLKSKLICATYREVFGKKTLLSKPKLMYAAVLPESPILPIRADRDFSSTSIILQIFSGK